jgi:hypothetical protein
MRVLITKPSDSNFKAQQIVSIEEFIKSVKYVLENGGEMPIGIPIP